MSDARNVVEVPEGHDLWTRLAHEERQRQGDRHPRAEQLTAYQAGELEAEEAEMLQAHLAVCRICAQALLDLPAFYMEGQTPALCASSEDVEAPSPAQTEASWRAVRDRLASAERRHVRPHDAPAFPAGQDRRLHPQFIFSPAVFLGMALSLLSSLIGFPAWIMTHGPEVIVYMPPLTEVTRSSENQPALDIALPIHHGPLTVVCPVPAGASASYQAELQPFHATGPRIPAEAVRQAGAASSVTVKFPGDRLAPGDYLLVVNPPRGDPLEWPLHIHAPG